MGKCKCIQFKLGAKYPQEVQIITLTTILSLTMLFLALGLWGCMPELTKNCVDMTNASSTYLSLGLGAIIGAVISWWIYNMQKKTSMKQDETQTHKPT